MVFELERVRVANTPRAGEAEGCWGNEALGKLEEIIERSNDGFGEALRGPSVLYSKSYCCPSASACLAF